MGFELLFNEVCALEFNVVSTSVHFDICGVNEDHWYHILWADTLVSCGHLAGRSRLQRPVSPRVPSATVHLNDIHAIALRVHEII